MNVGIFLLTTVLTLTTLQSWAAPTKAPKELSENRSRFEQLELFNKVLHLIETQYYRKVSTDKLIEGAIKGMMDTLDPHSSFLNQEYFKKMQDDTAGEFGGLGLEVTQKDGALVVITPIADTPAYKAGIRPKDKIVEINHESILGLNLEEALDRMRGKNGEKTHLGIVRENEEGIKHFTIKRELIKINPVKTELLDDSVAYIRLIQFQKKAGVAVEEALKKLQAEAAKKGGLKGIILDLRSNPGGLLDQAVDVASVFLKDGIVVSTESRDPQNKDIRYVKKSGHKDLVTPLAVLINGASASASEIVAGALQDYGRGIIMGTQSFGKGSVQTMAQLDHGTGMKLTIAQYMTPKNRKIQAVGIVPDVEIDDLDWKKFQAAKRSDRHVRERDLKNYLSATVETSDEEKQREATDKELRKKRIADYNQQKKSPGKSAADIEEEIYVEHPPKEDYQVIQAGQYLKTLNFWEKRQSKQ